MTKDIKKFKTYFTILLLILFAVDFASPCYAVMSQKAIQVTDAVIQNPTNETVSAFTKAMIKEAKRAKRQENFDDAADYYRSALYFLKQNPDSDQYKKTLAELETVLNKQGASTSLESRLEVAKAILMEKKYFAAAYELTDLLNEGYKEDVCYEYLGDISEVLKTDEISFVFYKKAVQLNPDNISVKYKYANALLNKGMDSDAIYYFEDVIKNTDSTAIVKDIINTFEVKLKQNPNDENYYGILGLAHQKLGEYDKTYKYLKHSLLLNPEDIYLRYYLADLLFNIQEYSFANEVYSEILEENPYESQIRISRAKSYASMGDIQKSLNDYKVVLAMYPDSLQAQYGIYNLLKNNKSINDILNSFYPLDSNYKISGDNLEDLGYFANKMGKTSDALTFFEKAKEINPKSETAYIELYKIYQLTGNGYKADEILKTAYKLFPNNQEIIDLYSAITSSVTDEKNSVALSYLNEGDYKKALQVYSQVEPKTAETYIAMGNCYKQLNDLKNAILCYKKALAIDSSNSETYYMLGVALLESNDMKGAAAAFKASVKRDATNIKSKKMLSYLEQNEIGKSLDLAYDCYDRGNYELALKYLNTAIKDFPNDPKAYFYRGLTKVAMGNYAMAVADFRKTIDVDRNYVDAYYYLAENLERINKKKEALYMYEKFLGADNIDEQLAAKAQSRVLDLGDRYY